MKDRKTKSKLILIVSWAAVLFWMGLIFYLSAQVASQSDELSQGIAERLFGVIAKIIPGVNGDFLLSNFVVRKSAHFLSYLMLGLLTTNALRRSGVKGVRHLVIAIGICVLYAISDEVHQLFVPGRSGQIKDVLLDSGGAIVGTALHRLFERRE
ncbi:putative integral membrane protein [Desulfitobacterium dehalogenans ATCC 51507]|uniref:Putative integral membrane protein n=1 Tax=Desulfitobacterium dehalogenans (strain ATCC 51507 / DSM 9161 / JW/IU-DC1) TaxID=756499 RepID=I4ADQ9_DESDJ|nr:VanZ family protein [Desulfitobacterium dehalogenans]AFM02094.1 putative integral membrane protein [Desulfitobacterium dehalogenans ATCC 51507]